MNLKRVERRKKLINKSRRYFYEGIKAEYQDAEIVICGVPYDGTCSNKPGTRFGPNELRKEINGLETYSPYQNLDLKQFSYCDMGDLELPIGNSEHVIETIYKDYQQILKDEKRIVTIGGEHLITYPIVKAYVEVYKDLHILHFDAHTDLRDEFFGEKLSHANVIKLIYNEMTEGKIYQFGIRSGTQKEFEFGRKYTNLHFNSLEGLNQVIEEIGNHPVYVTIDLDVLDPSIFPGTGTPEPGGVSFQELIESILLLKNLHIVGADVVELSPQYDLSGVSNVVAAKVLREISLIMNARK